MNDEQLKNLEQEMTAALDKKIDLEDQIEEFSRETARHLLKDSSACTVESFADTLYLFSARSTLKKDVPVVQVRIRHMAGNKPDLSIPSKQAATEYDGKRSMQETVAMLVSILIMDDLGLEIETYGEEE